MFRQTSLTSLKVRYEAHGIEQPFPVHHQAQLRLNELGNIRLVIDDVTGALVVHQSVSEPNHREQEAQEASEWAASEWAASEWDAGEPTSGSAAKWKVAWRQAGRLPFWPVSRPVLPDSWLTAGRYEAKCFAVFQSDLNLVVYRGSSPADNQGVVYNHQMKTTPIKKSRGLQRFDMSSVLVLNASTNELQVWLLWKGGRKLQESFSGVCRSEHPAPVRMQLASRRASALECQLHTLCMSSTGQTALVPLDLHQMSWLYNYWINER